MSSPHGDMVWLSEKPYDVLDGVTPAERRNNRRITVPLSGDKYTPILFILAKGTEHNFRRRNEGSTTVVFELNTDKVLHVHCEMQFMIEWKHGMFKQTTKQHDDKAACYWLKCIAYVARGLFGRYMWRNDLCSLLEIINKVMDNNKQFLYKIQIDVSGRRLKMIKLNMMPYSCSNVLSPNDTSQRCIALAYLEARKGFDALSMKLGSVLYSTGDMVNAEREITSIQMQQNLSDVQTMCIRYRQNALHDSKLENVSTSQNQVIILRTAVCTIFLQGEINCVPHELQYELCRYVYSDYKNRQWTHLHETNKDNNLLFQTAVDYFPYLYFLQYKTFGHLQKRKEQLQALRHFYCSICFEPDLGHRHTAYNLLGQCLEQENRHTEAFLCYIASLRNRKEDNAARILLCIQLVKLRKLERKLFQLRWLLVHVGTKVLQTCFDDLVRDDFAEYLDSNEAEKIKLHWLIDTDRLSNQQMAFLLEVENKTPPEEKSEISENRLTLLTVLLRFVCGLCAPNDEVWKKPLLKDMSIEADISRLRDCRNQIMKWNSFEDNFTDEMIAEQRQILHEILTRLDTNVEIEDDVEFNEHIDNLLKQKLEQWNKNDLQNAKLEEEYAQNTFFQDFDDDWTKGENSVLSLLRKGKLPKTKQLSMICNTFQSKSYIVREVCGYICNTLQMTSKHIKHCWPAYAYNKKRETNTNLVTFVIVKDTEDELNIAKHFGYNLQVYEQFNNSHSAESTEMMNQDMKHTRKFNDKLEKCLRKHSSALMRSHSNITLIAGSTVKSEGYKREIGKGTTISKPCIVIYVQTKGYIPLGEEPFPTKLDDFDTDVRECVVSLYSNSGAFQKNDNLLMGTSIERKGVSQTGTLGGFLEHPDYSLCGLTCAHVVLHARELNNISGLQKYNTDTGKGKIVVQPASQEGDKIGEVACALLWQDEPVGIDIALVKIQARPPIFGQFAIEEYCGHKYNSGNTLHLENIQRGAKLIKFGCETGHTEADYQYLGTGSLRYGKVHLPNQLIIRNHHKPSQTDQVADERPAQAGPFAAAGDSGALCFVEDSKGLHAVGVIVGGSGDLNNCFLTPIHAILDALKEKDSAQVTMRTFPDHEPMEH